MKKKKQLNQISWTWNLAFIFILGIVALLTVLPLLLIVIFLQHEQHQSGGI